MDKRLYRLRLIYWSLSAEDGQVNHSPSAESRFEVNIQTTWRGWVEPASAG